MAITKEYLSGLGIDAETADKIFAERSREIETEKSKYQVFKTENEKLNKEIGEFKEKVQELSKSASTADEYKKRLDKLQEEARKKEEADKAAQAEVELISSIEAVFGEKKFTSDYARKGIISDMKAEIAKPENKGKGYSEIFDELTKDKDGIFQNPNPLIDIPGISKSINTDITKEQFSKMGYAARNKLFNENRELYNKLNGE